MSIATKSIKRDIRKSGICRSWRFRHPIYAQIAQSRVVLRMSPAVCCQNKFCWGASYVLGCPGCQVTEKRELDTWFFCAVWRRHMLGGLFYGRIVYEYSAVGSKRWIWMSSLKLSCLMEVFARLYENNIILASGKNIDFSNVALGKVILSPRTVAEQTWGSLPLAAPAARICSPSSNCVWLSFIVDRQDSISAA